MIWMPAKERGGETGELNENRIIIKESENHVAAISDRRETLSLDGGEFFFGDECQRRGRRKGRGDAAFPSSRACAYPFDTQPWVCSNGW